MSGPPLPDLVHNERAKLTAGYLNGAAGAFLTAGVIAPLIAGAFGLAGAFPGSSRLTVAVGAPIFLAVSAAIHAAARHVLKGLRS